MLQMTNSTCAARVSLAASNLACKSNVLASGSLRGLPAVAAYGSLASPLAPVKAAPVKAA
jgi:hypothetical protein